MNLLLEKDNAWCWGPAQQEAFANVKSLITKALILAISDPNKKTTISFDCSSFGIEACLLPLHENGENRPVAYISRTLNDAESKYTNIEKEALTITCSCACSKLSDYIIGLKIFIETDHKPLV